MQQLKECLEIAAYAVAILAAIGSFFQYRRNSARERTRWLFELYQRFYEHSDLKKMRVKIDWGETAFVKKGEDKELLKQLDDYLNFFEFLAFLYKTREVKKKEIEAMFDYPLRTMAKDKDVRDYIANPEYGYEGIRELFRLMRYT